jgi:hypothetical protein
MKQVKIIREHADLEHTGFGFVRFQVRTGEEMSPGDRMVISPSDVCYSIVDIDKYTVDRSGLHRISGTAMASKVVSAPKELPITT